MCQMQLVHAVCAAAEGGLRVWMRMSLQTFIDKAAEANAGGNKGKDKDVILSIEDILSASADPRAAQLQALLKTTSLNAQPEATPVPATARETVAVEDNIKAMKNQLLQADEHKSACLQKLENADERVQELCTGLGELNAKMTEAKRKLAPPLAVDDKKLDVWQRSTRRESSGGRSPPDMKAEFENS